MKLLFTIYDIAAGLILSASTILAPGSVDNSCFRGKFQQNMGSLFLVLAIFLVTALFVGTFYFDPLEVSNSKQIWELTIWIGPTSVFAGCLTHIAVNFFFWYLEPYLILSFVENFYEEHYMNWQFLFFPVLLTGAMSFYYYDNVCATERVECLKEECYGDYGDYNMYGEYEGGPDCYCLESRTVRQEPNKYVCQF